MRGVLQRVSRASVAVDGEVVGSVGRGFLLLVGVGRDDGPRDADALAAKVASLRVFPDDEGRMNSSLSQMGGAVLVVSQFTLLADLRKGRRPSFTAAAAPGIAEPLVARVVERLQSQGIRVAGGVFGASMQVELVNDGPVTIVVDTADGRVV